MFILLAYNVYPVSVVADTVETFSELSDITVSVTNAAAEYEDNFYSVEESGQFSLLYQARQLFNYSTCVYFLIDNYDLLSDAVADKGVAKYCQTLNDMCVSFNARYDRNSMEFTRLKFEHKGLDIEQLTDDKQDDIKTACLDLAETYVKYLNDQYARVNLSEGSLENAKTKWTSLCVELYKCVRYSIDAIDEMNSLAPTVINEEDNKKTKHVMKSYKFSGQLVRVHLVDLVNTYNDAYNLGYEIVNLEIDSNNKVTINKTLTDLENMADVEAIRDSSGQLTGSLAIAQDPKLSMAYLALLSAGATYVPFESYVGSARFITAVQSLCEDEETASGLLSFYNDMKLAKKPLYFRGLNDDGIPEGEAKLITIKEFFSKVKSGKSGALCTVIGELRYNVEIGSWIYAPEKLDSSRRSLLSDLKPAGVNSGNTLGVPVDPTQSLDTDNTEASISGILRIAEIFVKPVYAAEVTSPSTEDSTSESEGTTSEDDEDGESDETDSTEDSTEAYDNEGLTGDNNNEYSSDTPANGNGEKYQYTGTDIVGSISAGYTIADDSRIGGPVALFGSEFERGIDNLSTVVFSNIINGASNYDNIDNINTEFLYVNAFGDIVTEDDLVIIPGIANPILYKSGVSYNPYTVAFMNNYPTNVRNSAYYRLASKSDIGQYAIFYETPDDTVENVIAKYNEDSEYDLEAGHFEAAIISSITGVKTSETLTVPKLYNKFIYGDYDRLDAMRMQMYIFGSNTNKYTRPSKTESYIALTSAGTLTANRKQVFPYKPDKDTQGVVAEAIANNMFQYLTTDDITHETGNVRKLNDNWILHYILLSGYEGTTDAPSYASNAVFQYAEFINDSADRAIKSIKQFSEKLLSSVENVNGILGLKSSYEDTILGRVVMTLREYWLIALAAFMLIVAFAVIRIKRDALQSLILIVVAFTVSYAFVYIVPIYVPILYNSLVNNISDRLAYKVVAEHAEYSDSTIESVIAIDESGHFKYNSGSITLYRLPYNQLEKFYDGQGITLTDASGGNVFVLNQSGGMFLEGDCIKMNIDVLFETLKIEGTDTLSDKDKGDKISNARHLHAYKTTSNSLDYYTPYYSIVDNLITKVNKISDVYDIPPTTLMYHGKSKDAYLVYSYVNSPVFIHPDEYGDAILMDQSGWTDNEVEEYNKRINQTNTALRAAFGEKGNEDWLGMSDLLYGATKGVSDYQQTLWFQTLCNNGYYTETSNGVFSPNEDKLDDLISYVNYQTKNFVYDISDQVGTMSDDVMIKIIALRALMAMNQKASDYKNWLYPFTLNYPELSLGNIMNCVVINDYDEFIMCGLSVTDYVAEEFGWFNLVLFDVVMLILFILSIIAKFILPFVYLSVGVLVIIKLITLDTLGSVAKGFVKCSLLLILSIFLQNFSIIMANKFCNTSACMLIMLLILAVALYLYFTVFSALLFNFVDFGNSALNAKFDKMPSFSTLRNRFKKVRVDTTNISKHRESKPKPSKVTKNDYRFDSYDDMKYSEPKAKVSSDYSTTSSYEDEEVDLGVIPVGYDSDDE